MGFNSLKARFRIALIGLAILPLLSVGLALSIRTYTSQQNQVIQLQEEISQRIADEVQGFVEARITELGVASQVSGAQTGDADSQHRFLNELLSYQPAFDGLALIDSTGQEVARVSRLNVVTENDLLNRSQSEEFIVPHDTGENFIGSARVDPATAQLVSTISIPLVNPRTGDVAYILAADVRLSFLGNLLSDVKNTTTTYVLNGAGRVVAHPNSSIVLLETYYDLPEELGVNKGLSGEESVIAFTRLPISNDEIFVVAEQPVSEAFSLVRTTALVLGVAMMTTLIIALLLATLGVRFIIKPLQDLALVAEKIQRGDLSQRASINSSDEIGVLAHVFNGMTEQLSQLIGNLEHRVQERTRDLQVAADVSLQISTQLDSSKLLANVVEQTAQAFGLYHVSIFLYDEHEQVLKLKQGVGDSGRQMVAMGKQFKLTDKGLVPTAAQTRHSTLSNDVTQNPDHVVNSLLPKTRSELVIPMIYLGILIGVLDIQSEQVNQFRDEDIRIMRTLADQIAIAVRNSQLFEETKAAKEEAEKADTVKSAFLASMSHELRTPLNAIINFSKFLKKGIPGPVNEEQQELIGSIADSGQHLLNLINDVLDMSKIEAGALKLYVEPDIDLNNVIQTAIQYVQPLLADKPVEIQKDVPDALPLLNGDRKRLLQIFLNVLSNACKFTDEGHVRIHVRDETDQLLISIEDTGCGIASEDSGHVFTAFKQTESGIRQGGGGTGLGMPICQKLVEAHEGRIWFESHVGKGTTFYIELPLQTRLETNGSKHDA